MRRIVLKIGVIIISSLFLFQSGTAYSYVTRERDKMYIVDKTGEKWDVTQAKSIGFDPHRFQYGIGKNAFTTLNDSHLKDKASSSRDYRVIGIANSSESQAYSVSKLRSHEVANTTLGSRPIAVGY
jgi:hypothetical protein